MYRAFLVCVPRLCLQIVHGQSFLRFEYHTKVWVPHEGLSITRRFEYHTKVWVPHEGLSTTRRFEYHTKVWVPHEGLSTTRRFEYHTKVWVPHEGLSTTRRFEYHTKVWVPHEGLSTTRRFEYYTKVWVPHEGLSTTRRFEYHTKVWVPLHKIYIQTQNDMLSWQLRNYRIHWTRLLKTLFKLKLILEPMSVIFIRFCYDLRTFFLDHRRRIYRI